MVQPQIFVESRTWADRLGLTYAYPEGAIMEVRFDPIQYFVLDEKSFLTIAQKGFDCPPYQMPQINPIKRRQRIYFNQDTLECQSWPEQDCFNAMLLL